MLFFLASLETWSESLGQLTTTHVINIFSTEEGSNAFSLPSEDPNGVSASHQEKTCFDYKQMQNILLSRQDPSRYLMHGSTFYKAHKADKVRHSKGPAPISNNRIEQLLIAICYVA